MENQNPKKEKKKEESHPVVELGFQIRGGKIKRE